jgi:Uma2 family endonuclease
MAIQPQLCTVAEFEHFLALPEHRDRFFELIHGEIVEKAPTEEHGLIAGNLCGFLWQYTKQSGIGRAVIEVRVQVPEDDYNSRQPDLAVFVDTLQGEEVLPGFTLPVREIFALPYVQNV